MRSGPITRSVRDRGFGFVRTETGSEIFFHHSALLPGVFDALAEGQALGFAFEIDPRGRGERARDIRVVGRQIGS